MAARAAVAAVAVLACVGICAANAPIGFIRAQDSRFVDANCNEFNFVGANAWRMPEMAAGLYPYADGSGWPTNTSWLIRPENPAEGAMPPPLWQIRQMQTSNLTVLRVFGTGADSTFYLTMQPGTAGADGKTWPNGVYNADFVTGVETIVNWCRAHGVKVMFTFLDNWSTVDSISAFVAFASNATGQTLTLDDFWSNELCMQYYKNLVSFWLNHPNAQMNGLQFKDDDAIIGWNLFNEPRCNCDPTVISQSGQITSEATGSDCGDVTTCAANIKTWIAEMAAFVKSIAPMQLLGVGDEGFATNLNNQDSDALVASNPGPWAVYTGDSFMNQAQPGIDYHSTHLWVDNWDVAESDSNSDASVATSAPNPATSFNFDRTWLSTRMAVAQADGRPFVIEEWGKFIPRPVTLNDADIQTIRDPWFQEIFNQTNSSIFAEEPLRAVMIWKFAETDIDNSTGKEWIATTDTTWTQIIEPYAQKISAHAPPVASCMPGVLISSSTVSVQTQSATIPAGRRLLSADSDSASEQREVQYVTRGNHLLATQPGKVLGDELTEMEGPHSCATACEEHTECTGFDYHKAFRRCVLKRGSGRDVMFDRDGWQTYWHEQHFEDWHARGRLDFLRQLLFRLFGFLF